MQKVFMGSALVYSKRAKVELHYNKSVICSTKLAIYSAEAQFGDFYDFYDLRLGRFNLATVRFGNSSKLARFIKYVLLRYPTGDQCL